MLSRVSLCRRGREHAQDRALRGRRVGEVVDRLKAEAKAVRKALEGAPLCVRGQAYLDRGMYEKAEVLLLKAHSTFGETLGENHPRTQEAVKRLESLYTAWGKPRFTNEHQNQPESPEKE